MPTWTVVGLVNEAGDELYVAAVFEGDQANCDKNVDADVHGEVMDQFVGPFIAEDADAAAELARDVIKKPIPGPAVRTHSRAVVDALANPDLL